MSEFEDKTSTSCVYDSTLAQLHAQGRAQEFVREHDARREQIGQIAFLHAVRN